jgi:peroxiredoxin
MLYGIITSVLAGSSPKVGDLAPEFTVTDTDGKTHTLSKMLENGPVVVAFFPKAFTSG